MKVIPFLVETYAKLEKVDRIADDFIGSNYESF